MSLQKIDAELRAFSMFEACRTVKKFDNGSLGAGSPPNTGLASAKENYEQYNH